MNLTVIKKIMILKTTVLGLSFLLTPFCYGQALPFSAGTETVRCHISYYELGQCKTYAQVTRRDFEITPISSFFTEEGVANPATVVNIPIYPDYELNLKVNLLRNYKPDEDVILSEINFMFPSSNFLEISSAELIDKRLKQVVASGEGNSMQTLGRQGVKAGEDVEKTVVRKMNLGALLKLRNYVSRPNRPACNPDSAQAENPYQVDSLHLDCRILK